jgi:hypothetical protein
LINTGYHHPANIGRCGPLEHRIEIRAECWIVKVAVAVKNLHTDLFTLNAASRN